jgi:hypothetical protein
MSSPLCSHWTATRAVRYTRTRTGTYRRLSEYLRASLPTRVLGASPTRRLGNGRHSVTPIANTFENSPSAVRPRRLPRISRFRAQSQLSQVQIYTIICIYLTLSGPPSPRRRLRGCRGRQRDRVRNADPRVRRAVRTGRRRRTLERHVTSLLDSLDGELSVEEDVSLSLAVDGERVTILVPSTSFTFVPIPSKSSASRPNSDGTPRTSTGSNSACPTTCWPTDSPTER